MESLSFSTHTDICQDAFISPGLSVIAYGRISLHPSNPDMRPHILSIPYITCLLPLGSGKHFASSCAMLRGILKRPQSVFGISQESIYS